MNIKMPAPPIVCKDGTRLSVQASRHCYSIPRDDVGPYTHVEVGFPSIVPPITWEQYSDSGKLETETVYGYIPVALVERFIKAHGGIAEGSMP